VSEISEPRRPDGSSGGALPRFGWTTLGLVAVGVGGVGIVVPGLPTTVFFIVAAWAFSKSSPRLEAWVLDLPRIGPLVRDHRNGLGMPRASKRWATGMIVLFVGLSVWLAQGWTLRLAITGLALVGISYIWFRVPTRERVLQERTVR